MFPLQVHPDASARARPSLTSVGSASVIVEAVKEAEDGFVLRLYEAWGTENHADLCLSGPVRSVSEANLRVEAQGDIMFSDGDLSLYFRPL